MATTVIHKSLNTLFEIRGPFAELNTRDRKRVMFDCMREGGEFFRQKYIPLRFTNYAYALGYRVTDAWKAEKRRILKAGPALPYIGLTRPGGGDGGSLIPGAQPNPEKMAVAMERGCRVDITGTAKGASILIRTPYGHPIQPLMAESFKRVLPAEYNAVTVVVARTLNEFLRNGVRAGRSKRLIVHGSTSGWRPRGSAFKSRKGS